MIIIEIDAGRFYVNGDYSELADGRVAGSHSINGQRGQFTYRNREHFMAEHSVRSDEDRIFTAAELQSMRADGVILDTRFAFDLARKTKRAHAADMVKADAVRKHYKDAGHSVRISEDGHIRWKHKGEGSWLEGRWVSEYRVDADGRVRLV